MIVLFALIGLFLLGPSVHSDNVTSPLTFHASFDGTLDALTRGEGKPVKVEGPVSYRPGKVGQALLCGEGGAAVHYATASNLRAAAGTVEMYSDEGRRTCKSQAGRSISDLSRSRTDCRTLRTREMTAGYENSGS